MIDIFLTRKGGSILLHSFDRAREMIDGFETENVKILYYDLPKNYSGYYKSYGHMRFCTILNGKKHVTLNDNKQFTYSENKYLILSPYTKVHMDIPTDTKALVLELNDELIHKVISKIDLSEEIKENINIQSPYFLGENGFNIKEDISSIFLNTKSKEKNNEFLIDLYAQKLIFDLVKTKAVQYILNANSTSPIAIALHYIDENIQSRINVNDLAKELDLSLSNFTHLFKKITGKTPTDYIKNKKLELALQYLRRGTVTDVAYDLGYENISYFIRLFKNKYNLTPKQYKLTYYNK